MSWDWGTAVNWDWGTATICLFVVALVTGIALGLAGWLGPRIIDEALTQEEAADDDLHWPGEDEGQDPTIRHALALARRPGTLVLMTVERAHIYPVRGIAVSLERRHISEAEDRFLRSRVR